MFEKSPLGTKDEVELTAAQLAMIRLSVEWPRRLGRVANGIGTVALSGVLVLQADIMANKAELEHSSPIVHTISTSDTEYNSHAIMVIDGFGGQDGSWAARSLEKPILSMIDGDLLALEQDKDGISINAIADRAAAYAEKHRLSSLSLYGYSLGGIEALKVASVLRDEHHITVPFIFLDRVPSHSDNIKPQMRGQAASFLEIVDALKIEGTDIGMDIQYSRILRTLFNVMSPDDVSHLSSSTTPFLVDQLTMGMTANTKDDIEKLNSDSRAAPVLVYVTSPRPEKDYFVDLEASLIDFRQYAADSGLELVVVSVDAIHSRPDLSQAEYQAAYEVMQGPLSIKRDQMNDAYLFASGATIHQYVRIP